MVLTTEEAIAIGEERLKNFKCEIKDCIYCVPYKKKIFEKSKLNKDKKIGNVI